MLPSFCPKSKIQHIILKEQTKNPEGSCEQDTAGMHLNWDCGSRAQWSISSWAAPPLLMGAGLSSTQNPAATEEKGGDADRQRNLEDPVNEYIDDNNLNDNQRK